MFRHALSASLLAMCAACVNAPVDRPIPTLTPLWVADGFAEPEGAALHPEGGYLISNVNGNGREKDGDGFISWIAADGTMITRNWADGIDAPKGITVHDGIVYVADIDTLHRIDVETGAAYAEITFPDADMLNDVTPWRGEIMVSDSGTATIFSVSDDDVIVFATGAHLEGVNGLLGDGDRLLVSTMESGSLLALDTAGDHIEIAAGMNNADGIGHVPGGGYLVSSWPGQIHAVSPGGGVETLIDTEDDTILQNDLSVFGDVVIVPNWIPGTVTAWRIG